MGTAVDVWLVNTDSDVRWLTPPSIKASYCQLTPAFNAEHSIINQSINQSKEECLPRDHCTGRENRKIINEMKWGLGPESDEGLSHCGAKCRLWAVVQLRLARREPAASGSASACELRCATLMESAAKLAITAMRFRRFFFSNCLRQCHRVDGSWLPFQQGILLE